MRTKTLTKAELARRLGVSRTHITLLTQGKRKLSDKLADKLADLLVDLRADNSNAYQRTSNPLGGNKLVSGGFDPHALPPICISTLLTGFLNSRRQGLSKRTQAWYSDYLNLAHVVVGIGVTGQDISQFLNTLPCSNGGKHAYYRALKAFYNWL